MKNLKQTNIYYHKIIVQSYIRTCLVIIVAIVFNSNYVIAQNSRDTDTELDKPVRNTFRSAYLISNQSVDQNNYKTLEFIIQHRFGLINNGISDIYGVYGPSNIRIGLNYTILKNVALGFGTTKNNKLQDFNLKWSIIRQTRLGKIPLSLTYYGNVAIDARSKDNFANSSDRLSYFHQLIIARKISKALAIQVAPSLSHFNIVNAYWNENGEKEGLMNNDHFAIATSGQWNISSQSSLILNYDQPITKHKTNNPHPNLSVGWEIMTSSHAFQIFVSNYNAIVPQYNNVFNSNDYRNGDFLIGFNITRLWGF